MEEADYWSPDLVYSTGTEGHMAYNTRCAPRSHLQGSPQTHHEPWRTLYPQARRTQNGPENSYFKDLHRYTNSLFQPPLCRPEKLLNEPEKFMEVYEYIIS